MCISSDIKQDLLSNHSQVLEQRKKTNNVSSNLKQFGTTVALTGIATAIDLKGSRAISDIAANTFGICMGNVVSTGGKRLLASMVSPLAKLNLRAGALFGGDSITSTIFVPALCEEVEFRWFVQDVLMRQLPKKVIEQINPDYSHIVDSNPAKITRVAAAALFFAACHTQALDCSQGGGIYQLIGGLFYGAIYEYTDVSLMATINLHCLYNALNHFGF